MEEKDRKDRWDSPALTALLVSAKTAINSLIPEVF